MSFVRMPRTCAPPPPPAPLRARPLGMHMRCAAPIESTMRRAQCCRHTRVLTVWKRNDTAGARTSASLPSASSLTAASCAAPYGPHYAPLRRCARARARACMGASACAHAAAAAGVRLLADMLPLCGMGRWHIRGVLRVVVAGIRRRAARKYAPDQSVRAAVPAAHRVTIAAAWHTHLPSAV